MKPVIPIIPLLFLFVLPAMAVEPVKTDKGELVMNALAGAFPKLVSTPVFKNGDWAVTLRGEVFFYAGGRLLPESLLPDLKKYAPCPFYNYPEQMPEWKKPSAEEVKMIKSREEERLKGSGTARSNFFYDMLWNAKNRNEAWIQTKSMKFLKKEILVHHAILEPLAMVEQRINELALNSTEISNWLKNIETIHSWNWRNIAGLNARSNHAYGTAIDILPKNLKKKETYWLWTKRNYSQWWNVPYSQRYSPPEKVIKIFEDYGFIWGGKWLFYDTMHFEYRPELLIYNQIPLAGEY